MSRPLTAPAFFSVLEVSYAPSDTAPCGHWEQTVSTVPFWKALRMMGSSASPSPGILPAPKVSMTMPRSFSVMMDSKREN